MTEPTTAAADTGRPAARRKPPTGTAEAVAAEFHRLLAGVGEMSDASALYRDGLTRGWKLVIDVAEQYLLSPRVSEADLLRRLGEHLRNAEDRIKGTITATPSPGAQPEIRQGREDAYSAALRVCGRAIEAAERAEDEQRARRAALARQDTEDEIRNWNGYPLVPMPADEPVDDMSKLAMFLGGDGTSFTGDLLRLIARADPANLQRLSRAFPRHVRAFLLWRACAPIPVGSLVALLNATTMITEREL